MNKLLSPSRLAHGAVSLAVLLLLAACGGGGGGGSDDDDTALPSTVSVSGVASKGLLKNAIVRALRVNADGSTTLIKESVTDTNGSYELTGIPAGTVVVVEISAGANTRMVDEASDNTDVPLPSGFRMRAAVVTQEGGANTVQVTPFSEMAVAKAQAASGGLTSANVEGANADIRQYLGFDVISEPPVFNDNGTTPANKAALMLAAISQVANDSAALSTLGCSGNDLGDKIKCVVDEMAARGSDDNTLAQTIDTAKDAVVNDDYVGEEVPTAPVPQPEVIVPPAEGATSVAAAKALIASLRSNFNAIGAEGPDSIKGKLQAVESAFSQTGDLVAASQDGLLNAMLAAMSELDAVRSGDLTGSFPTANYVFRPQVQGAMSVACRFYKDNSFLPAGLATSYDDAAFIGCTVGQAIVTTQQGTFSVQYRFGVNPDTVDAWGQQRDYVINNRATRQAVQLSGSTWVPINSNEFTQLSDFRQVGISIDRNDQGTVRSLDVQGTLSGAIGEDGSHDNGYQWLALSISPDRSPCVAPSGNVGSSAWWQSDASAQITRLKVSGEVSARNVDNSVRSSVSIKPGSCIQSRLAVPDDLSSGVVSNADSGGYFLVESQVGGEGPKVTGALTVSGWTKTKDTSQQDDVPTSVHLSGRILEAGGSTLFEGDVKGTLQEVSSYDAALPEGPGNHVVKQVVVGGTLFVPGRPATMLNVTLRDPQFGSYTVDGTYTQGATTVNLSLTSQEGNSDATAQATFSTPSGLSVTLRPGDPVALLKVTQSSLIVARIEDGIIYYRDNTRESF